MKHTSILAAPLLASSLLLSACGGLGTTSSASSTSSSSGSGAASILGSVIGSALGGTSSSSTSSSETTSSSTSSSGLGSLIGGVLSTFTKHTTASTITGTWVYSKPAVQFESDNLLAKAGGSVASNAVVNKLEPYYQKVGITAGKFSLTLNSDKTCTYTVGGKTQSGTYTYDSSKNTLTIKGTLFSLPTAYVSVSGSQMALTFDSSKILSIAQTVGSASGNSSISQISELSKLYDGMKTGFLFNKN